MICKVPRPPSLYFLPLLLLFNIALQTIKMRTTLLALAGITAATQAPSSTGFNDSTTGVSRGGSAVCVSGTVLITASTTSNIKFNLAIPQNQTQLTEYLLEDITSGSPFTKDITGGKVSAAGTYTIGATLCTPANDTAPKGVQLLTHGVGFDRYYWDFAPGYSYVDAAVENGYAAFFYDRLGVGVSSKPDALTVVQSPLEVQIAYVLEGMLRKGSFSNIAFETVIGVGHSFGSISESVP